MKQLFENIIRNTEARNRNYVISQLQQIANKFTNLQSKVDRHESAKTGVPTNERDNVLETTLDILKLHGYTLVKVTNFQEPFLNFMLKNTLGNSKFKHEHITFNILDSLQQAYFIYNIEFSKEPENYIVLRNFLLTWEETLSQKHKKELELVYDD